MLKGGGLHFVDIPGVLPLTQRLELRSPSPSKGLRCPDLRHPDAAMRLGPCPRRSYAARARMPMARRVRGSCHATAWRATANIASERTVRLKTITEPNGAHIRSMPCMPATPKPSAPAESTEQMRMPSVLRCEAFIVTSFLDSQVAVSMAPHGRRRPSHYIRRIPKRVWYPLERTASALLSSVTNAVRIRRLTGGPCSGTRPMVSQASG